MKVGILTHHWLPNFGANLQAYATASTLQRLGHDPIFLNYRIPEIAQAYGKRTDPEQLEAHERFCSSHLRETVPFEQAGDIVDVAASEGLDAVLSGSDAVLRLGRRETRADLSFPNPFWLDWSDEAGSPRTGFLAASSMGSNYVELPRRVRRGVRDAVERLDVCSVRDGWTRAMLRLCGVPGDKIRHCPDPVSAFAGGGGPPDHATPDLPASPYILLGIPGRGIAPEWCRRFRSLANEAGYLTVAFPQPDVPPVDGFDLTVSLPLDPFDWLAWLRRSAGYVGVRFHPVMLCQTYDVPFVALDFYDFGIPFSSRPMKLAGRLAAPCFRQVSKTYDVCRRAGRERFAVPGRSIGRLTPEAAFSLLEEQRRLPSLEPVARSRKQAFEETLTAILGV